MNSRKIQFIYKLLDRNDLEKKLLFNVESCTVTYNSLGRFKNMAQMKLRDDPTIDWLNDRIQIICRLNDVDYKLGIYLISAPSRDKNEQHVTRDVTLYSKLILLDRDKVQDRYFIPKGTNVIAEVKRLIGNNPYRIEDINLVTSTDKEYAIGTPKLDIINELLDCINYNSLTVDVDGYFTTKPYMLPALREVEIEYKAGKGSILHKPIREDLDLFDVPNVFIRYTNNPDITPPLVARYENNNPDSPTSTVNTSINVNAEEVADVSDLATLMAKCKRDAYSATEKYSHIEFETTINPVHDYLNCIYIKYDDIVGKYIETSWEMECKAGGIMKHTCRKAVNI